MFYLLSRVVVNRTKHVSPDRGLKVRAVGVVKKLIISHHVYIAWTRTLCLEYTTFTIILQEYRQESTEFSLQGGRHAVHASNNPVVRPNLPKIFISAVPAMFSILLLNRAIEYSTAGGRRFQCNALPTFEYRDHFHQDIYLSNTSMYSFTGNMF
jgi:hypothetical protein